MPEKHSTKTTHPLDQATKVDLEDYIPYRLAVLSLSVSQSIASLYSEKFDIGIMEWRVIAILGSYQPLTANSICERTNMDKVQVSRAVASLTKKRLLSKKAVKDDRRKALLRLTAKGDRVYSKIVPIALKSEAVLLSALSNEEQAKFARLLSILEQQAKQLRTQPDE